MFYFAAAFDSVLATYAMCLERTPECVFYTIYQQRSHRRTLLPYLKRWNMQADVIPTSTVLKEVMVTDEEVLDDQELFIIKITLR